MRRLPARNTKSDDAVAGRVARPSAVEASKILIWVPRSSLLLARAGQSCLHVSSTPGSLLSAAILFPMPRGDSIAIKSSRTSLHHVQLLPPPAAAGEFAPARPAPPLQDQPQ